MQPKSLTLLTFLLGVVTAAPVADSPSGSIPAPSGTFSEVPPAFSEAPSGTPSLQVPSGFPTQFTVHPSGGPPASIGSFPVPSGPVSLPPPFSGTPPSPTGSFTGPHPSWAAVPPSFSQSAN